ncbi:MAG: helix-turn-helix transcriptional regulator [Psychrosphaera sp.]|nr:helix-turn-helix transcriptional regulator [Psychrosphaera sp.]
MKVSHCIAQIYHHSQGNKPAAFIRLCFDALAGVIRFNAAAWVTYSSRALEKVDQIHTYNLPENTTGQLAEIFEGDGGHPFFMGVFDQPGEALCYPADLKEQEGFRQSDDYGSYCCSLNLEHNLSVLITDEHGGRQHLIQLYRADGEVFFLEKDLAVLNYVLLHLGDSFEMNAVVVTASPCDVQKIKDEKLNSLTVTERNVADLIADGMRAKDIAKRLNSSSRTVEKHQAKIYVKLGTGNRNATVAYLNKIK